MLNLADYENKTRKALAAFWKSRNEATLNNAAAARTDRGERASVTAGKNMDEFVGLIADIVRANGLPDAAISQTRKLLTVPGYFRPTKIWDVLVTYKGQLIAVIELKSQVGLSFGNNFNNRTEEAIGSAVDFWTAYREGAFGKQPRPFVGWLMLVEDCAKSRAKVKDTSHHYPIRVEFQGASYLKRYDLLCQKLVEEQLYTAASVITSKRNSAEFEQLSDMTGIHAFISVFAGHIAATATRLDKR